jgi:hypothetical protein
MEEEGARRRNRARGPGGARAVLSGLNEDDEDEGDEDEDVHRQQRNGQAQVTAVPAAAYGQTGRRVATSHAIGEGRAGIRDQGSARVPGGTSSPGRSQRRHRQFELDIDGATLLERRNRRALGVNGPGAVGIARSSPLRMEGLRLDEARAPIQDPGSPMRVG